MKKVVIILLVVVMLLSLCACGHQYVCSKCGKTVTKAYYTLSGTKDDVLCEDCAIQYWMPLPYENYRVK